MTAGFFGKLPSRGDFVRAGLPASFVAPWDGWFQRGLASVRDNDAWIAAWLEAPVWRFRLAAGCCGPDPVVGLWLPSVDRAGRYFPLTVAAVGRPPVADFLDAAEQAALDAVASDVAPETLAARIAAAFAAAGADVPAIGATWWTGGAPRVPATRFVTSALPEGAAFAALLGMDWAPAEGIL